jgi:IS5 family transposase
MRTKVEPQRYLPCSVPSSGKVVCEYEAKYLEISKFLDANPGILALVDKDLNGLSRPSPRGRKATFTSEILLRTMIVHQIEGGSLRATEIQLSHDVFLQDFVRLGNRPTPSYSLLDRCLKAVGPETWAQVNELVTQGAQAAGRIDPAEIRVDTTVVETTIHWPTDSSLLWDSFRVLVRRFQEARDRVPGLIDNRFHEKKVKKLHLYVTRYGPSRDRKRQRKVRKCKLKLIDQVERIRTVATAFANAIGEVPDLALQSIAMEIEDYLPRIAVVLDVAKRAWIYGEVVPASDRIFSLFEPHTELIKRGRRSKPVEFGHAIWLGQSRERFITQYGVMEQKIPDSHLPERILEAHHATFGAMPTILAADKGFRGNAEAMKALREKVKVVAIPERLKDFAEDGFVKLQHFRAGIEGSISCLKRVFGLLRCQYRGFKSFASHVGLGVLCHNLVVLATSPP